MQENDNIYNPIENASDSINNSQEVEVLQIKDDMPEELKKAINYLNNHRFDNNVDTSLDDEANMNIFDYSDNDMEVLDTNQLNSTIIEDDNSTESFDDIGLF